MALVTACGLRVVASGARFDVSITRTLGNCFSISNVRWPVATVDVGFVKRMLVLADIPDVE